MRWIYLFLLLGPNLHAQIFLEGRVIDAKRGLQIANVLIRDSISSHIKAVSDPNGLFRIDISTIHLNVTQNLTLDPLGKDVHQEFVKSLTLIAEHQNYQKQIVPIDLTQLDGSLIIALHWQIEDQIELDLSSGVSEYDEVMDQTIISGPLNAYGDPVIQAEQFDFGPLFYSPMGADRTQRGLVFQGMNLQDPVRGSVHWAMLTGLNQSMRYRKNQNHFNPENEGFGQLGGTTYVGVRPNEFNPGTRIKTQVGNRSYQWGYSLQHVIPNQNGWSALALVSARDGLSGLTRGNRYNAWGGIIVIEKELNSGMSLGLTAAFTPIYRGITVPLTREVLDLKGGTYNPNWGWQNNFWRNSRESFTQLPFGVISLFGPKQSQNNWVLQLGTISGIFGQSRLNYSTGANPFGHYYTRLPSYFLSQDGLSSYDYYRAYIAQKNFESNGQIEWHELYAANRLRPQGDSQYLIQNETSRLREYQARIYFNRQINNRQRFSLSFLGRWVQQRNYAEISDLLGGSYYFDRNNFYRGIDSFGQWNNLDSAEKPLYVGDKIDYDYSMHGLTLTGFAQLSHAFKQGQLIMSLGYARMDSKRLGHMRHGIFRQEGNSFGPSAKALNQAFKAKIHWAHYWSGKWSSQVTAVYDQQLPTIDQTLVYSRYHNKKTLIDRVPELIGLFGQLRYQSSGLDLVVKPFVHYQQFNRQNTFFYSDHVRGALGLSGLVQQHLWDLELLGMGLRSGLKFMTGERLTWTAVHVLSQHTYTSNARLFLAGSNLVDADNNFVNTTYGDKSIAYNYVISDLDRLGSRKVFLSGYRPSIGPQHLFHATLTYRDPSFWWVGLALSKFSKRYVGLSALRRSEDAFFQNAHELGPWWDNFDLNNLWRQEELPAVSLASLKMGVSWRINEYYLSLFGSVQNLLNGSFVSGGFESSRKVYLPDLAQDQERPFGAVFGNKYFSGFGRSYYLTCSINF